jgi:hypothetical protein
LSSLRFCRQLLLPNAPESLDKYLGGMEHDGTLEALSLIWRCWRGTLGMAKHQMEFRRFGFWMIGF